MNNHEEEEEVDISYEMIYEIIKKPPKERTPDNIKYLMRLPVDLLKESLNPHAVLYARYLEFEQHKQNKQIFASKIRKNGIYWVIEGSFGVYNKKNVIIRVYKNLDYLIQNEVVNEFEDFQEVRALETTTIGFISDRSMQEIIEPLKKEPRWKLHDFLSCTPLFMNWPFNQIKQLLTFFNTLTFGKNSYVFQEKQESTAVYFIKDGQFDIRKNFTGASNLEERVKNENIVIKDLPVSKISKLQTKEFKISNLNMGDYVGEEDVINEATRSFSVLCNSLQGEVAFISAENFKEYIYSNRHTKQQINERMRKKEQMFQKREVNIKDSLNNYGKFLVNEHFNKNLDQIITELAIQPQVKTYNEIEKEHMIRQMQSLTNIQGVSPKKEKGLIRNETFADFEELTDEAVAKMVQNNLFSKKIIPSESQIDEQLQIIQEDEGKSINPSSVSIGKAKQSYLFDWKGKKHTESPNARTPSEQQRDNNYGLNDSNPPSRPVERTSVQSNYEYFLNDEQSKSPTRNSLSKQQTSPIQRYSTRQYFQTSQNGFSNSNSPQNMSMTEVFKQESDYPIEQVFKSPLPQISERNSIQNSGRQFINVKPTMQEKSRGNYKSQVSTEFNNTQKQQMTHTDQINQDTVQLNINKQESPSSQKLQQISSFNDQNDNSEKEHYKIQRIIEYVDDKFQSHHANLTNQCQNFFTQPSLNVQKSNQLNPSSSKQPGIIYTDLGNDIQSPDLIALNSYQQSQSNRNSFTNNLSINNLNSRENNLEQQTSQNGSNDEHNNSQNFDSKNSPQQISSPFPYLQQSEKLSSLSSQGNQNQILENNQQHLLTPANINQKNISFVDRIRNDVKGSQVHQIGQNQKISYNSQSKNISSPQIYQMNDKKGMSSTDLFQNQQNQLQYYVKKSTLTDLYLSQLEGQQEENSGGNEQDQQKSSNSLAQDDNLNSSLAGFNNNNKSLEFNEANYNQNIPRSLERKDNLSMTQNRYEFKQFSKSNTHSSDIINRKLLFSKQSSKYSTNKTSLPIPNSMINSNNLSQKLLSERYQKFKQQHEQIKKQQQAPGNYNSHYASIQQMPSLSNDDLNKKQSMDMQTLSKYHQSQVNILNSQYPLKHIDKSSLIDQAIDIFQANPNKIQKIITNQPQPYQHNVVSQSVFNFSKRAQSHTILPTTVLQQESKLSRDHLLSPQDHLQKILNKKEKNFRKNLFVSSGNQSTGAQQHNNDSNNPYFKTYIQLDYMNQYKLHQEKNKNYSGSIPQGNFSYIPISPEKKKTYDSSIKSSSKKSSQVNNLRQLVS